MGLWRAAAKARGGRRALGLMTRNGLRSVPAARRRQPRTTSMRRSGWRQQRSLVWVGTVASGDRR
ncbi:hypothetical protein E2562_033459 [Oryza meyeriana var. granulata]|uniref:Uncharacterized protein n=1 Tax=Oryza meyeriana var. granulata TaxID=110450 RepID=A0A6G1E608_9ORYZ|nr:hypothetical protein E2562_033459 [Oryza meyeriana var. granulata]